MVTAAQTETGKVYRKTRGSSPGMYLTRPKRTAVQYIAKLRRRKDPRTRDIWMMLLFRRDSTLVLMRRYSRRTDKLTGEKRESSDYILVPADLRLREVLNKPGYK